MLRRRSKLLPVQHNVKETGSASQQTEQNPEVQMALEMALDAPSRLPLQILTCACMLLLVHRPCWQDPRCLAVAPHADKVPLQPLPDPADLQVLPGIRGCRRASSRSHP